MFSGTSSSSTVCDWLLLARRRLGLTIDLHRKTRFPLPFLAMRRCPLRRRSPRGIYTSRPPPDLSLSLSSLSLSPKNKTDNFACCHPKTFACCCLFACFCPRQPLLSLVLHLQVPLLPCKCLLLLGLARCSVNDKMKVFLNTPNREKWPS